MRRQIILIKLGGSLITDKTKPFTEDLPTIKRLVREVSQGKKVSGKLLIIGHGGGSYPHTPAVKYKTAEGIVNKNSYQGMAVVQDAAAQLNRIVTREFIKAKEKAVSLNPSSFMISRNGEIKKAFLEPILKLLELGMLPLVYGDIILDLERGCTVISTEKILNYLAQKLTRHYQVNRIIFCGKTEGVYNKKGKVVKLLNKKRFNKLRREIGQSEGIDVTGGMLHKVEEALKLARKGIPSEVINGSQPRILKKAILGERFLGTRII